MPAPFGAGRHLFLHSAGHVGVPLPLALVQYATAGGVNSSQAAVLPASPTAGNLILVGIGSGTGLGGAGNPVQTVGPACTQIGSGRHAYTSGSGDETFSYAFYRKVLMGDGGTFNFVGSPNIGNYAFLVAEFSGIDLVSSPANVAGADAQASATVGVTVGGALAEAGFLIGSSRLEYQDPTHYGTIAPNGASTEVSAGSNDIAHGAYQGLVFINDTVGSIFMLFGAGNATLGGTMSGVTRDAYTYGYNAFSWARKSF